MEMATYSSAALAIAALNATIGVRRSLCEQGILYETLLEHGESKKMLYFAVELVGEGGERGQVDEAQLPRLSSMT
jgi:hypothetical protein